ncbi:glycerophosphodiester phosphodiesterase family protein [Neobacillus ginsengisoli]|uniref:Glycerophosphoryl diester phosphodiesterase n=1 Tax=Neobacillus ginsengisoli TaxID=904295 RepID=A0ABT9Y112_9BACI|nr:glycerophosphodiester phosphodiesterase family protein [Neobacillus ginsengisoli]MDQ0201210.1 glycerophosphoryl diester phosphodiesterase [Neobacillus ginsengisoli]
MKQSLILKLAFLSLCVTCLAPKALEILSQKTVIDYGLSKLYPNVPDVVVVAHRGASAYGPENSLAAYNQAILMHADYVELDLQMTKDGHLIAMHDESLERTTNAKKLYPQCAPWLVRDFNLREIRHLDAGSWFNRKYKKEARQEYKKQHVPTLKEVIQFVQKKGNGKVGLYIETKAPNVYPGMEETLVDILRKNGVLNKNNLILGSLSESSLRKLKTLAPGVEVVQLYSKNMLEGIDVKKEFKRISGYATGVGLSKELVVPKLLQVAHQNGLFVHSWTVNKQNDMAALLSLGVDGEITNKPDLFAELLEKR